MAKKKKTNTQTETKTTIEKKCYKFVENTFLWGIVYAKDSCIKLSKEELSVFWPYVKVCDKTTGKKPCKRC